jgi:[acyl-carrier-protein] S-malonyltransferase
MKKVFVFPGQGSQAVGMGKELFDAFSEAKEVFQEVDSALGQNLSKIIFEGPQDTLTLTENAQPALMATSMAVLRVLLKQSGKELPFFADYVAGHSLGEYSALCAAGSLNLSQTAKLLKLRGQSMQAAVPVGKGGMAAVMGLTFAQVEELCSKAHTSEEPCEIANDNSDGQIIVSGSATGIDKGEAIAKEMGAKRYLKLPVSAPFHSSLMKPAQDKMAIALQAEVIKTPVVPVIANVTAEATSSPDEIRKLLVAQVTGRVRWRESVMNMAGKYSVTSATEVGSGKVLSGLVKRIVANIETANIEKPADIEAFLKSKGL